MAILVESPNEVISFEKKNNKSVFLAGGIMGCPEWQPKLASLLKGAPKLTIYNPRRSTPFSDYDSYNEQVTWEFNHLRDVDLLSFWFSEGTPNPTTLFEYGLWAMSNDRPVVVGIDPNYVKKRCVETQTKLARPDVEIVYSLEELAQKIKEYNKA